jgi:hypothetical protein
VAVGIAFSALATAAAAQNISLDVSAGRIVYEPLSSNVATNNTSATLRVDLPPGAWVYGSGALPFGSNGLRWGAAGIGGRFLHSASSSHRVNIGADAVADGFLFHDAVLQQSGNGGLLEAIPFVQVPAGAAATVEVRGGWRGQMLSYGGTVDKHHVLETGVRATYGGPALLQADARWVRSDGAMYPFYGGRLVYNGAPLQAWLGVGKWFSAQLDDTSWNAGAGVRVATRLTVWAAVQQDAPDPLYWNLARRGWSIGITRTFGGSTSPVPLASSADPNGVLIRLNAADVDGASVSVAGDFNGWKPVPMVLDGREWQLRMPLAPGVYHYAFRSERGQWFVPESVPNRRDDGMGGFVAVLVVN